MSWSIHVIGERDAVRYRVAGASVHGQQQGEDARTFILACLESVPGNGVEVKAQGHHDQWTSTLSVDVRSVALALDAQSTPSAGAMSGTNDATEPQEVAA